jgi:palmitoyltransferase
MTGTSIDLAMNNLTQVEKLGSKTRTHVVAVLKPTPDQRLRVSPQQPQLAYPEITYPLRFGQPPSSGPMPYNVPQGGAINEANPVLAQSEKPSTAPMEPLGEPSSILPLNEAHGGGPPGKHFDPTNQLSALHSTTNNSEKPRGPLSARDLKASRTFAILRMAQGENPWDLGSRLLNLQTLMGTTVIDWFLPFRRSPCCNHEDPESHFAIGPSVDMLKASVSFIEAKDIRMSDGGKKPLRNPYLDIETTKHRPSESRRRRRRRKSHRKRERTDSFTNPSPDAENPSIQLQDMNGNASRR